MFEVARSAGAVVETIQARNWRFIDLFELGRIEEAERELAAYAADAERVRVPRFLWYVPLWRAALAILRGDFDRAAEWTEEACDMGTEAQDANAPIYRVIQDALRLCEQRCFDEVDYDELVDVAGSSPSGRASWLALLTFIEAARGEEERARRTFAELTTHPLALVPIDANWHVVPDAAEACAVAGTERVAHQLLEVLTPHASLCAVVGRGIGTEGPVAYFLGRLHAFLGQHDEAAGRFREALDLCEAMGARPRAALARLRLGEALRELDEPRSASREIDQAQREMERLGMRV